MKYIGENAIKKLISLIKGDLATKQDSITVTGVLERDTTGVINGVETVGATLVETQEATLVDVPNGLLKGDGATISAAVAGTDYVNSNQAIRYDVAQSLTDEQKTQARNNISAMQGIESTDHPGCNYVLNGSTVEWINPPFTGDEYTPYRTIDRYKAQPIYRGTMGDFEVWRPDSAVWPHGTKWGSAGKAICYLVNASETKNIPLTSNGTFLISWSDNVRYGLVVVQTGGTTVVAITNVVPPGNWKIEIGTGLSVNVTELDGQWDGGLSVFMI